jgi:3-hydroxypropanoate dehydrogenase
MHRIVNDEALDILFRAACARPAWLAQPVSDTMLRALWELVRLGPVSSCGPAVQLLFARSDEARARLAAALPPADREAALSAPVAAIVGHQACEPDNGAGHRDAALHAAYLMLGARALGLDCGPIWQFDAPLVDRMFFPEGGLTASFLCAVGYGDDALPASHETPRPGFDEACAIL